MLRILIFKTLSIVKYLNVLFMNNWYKKSVWNISIEHSLFVIFIFSLFNYHIIKELFTYTVRYLSNTCIKINTFINKIFFIYFSKSNTKNKNMLR